MKLRARFLIATLSACTGLLVVAGAGTAQTSSVHTGLAPAAAAAGSAATPSLAAASLAPTAGALETFAELTPSLSPDRLGARAALTVTIDYTGGAFGVPAPVTRSILRLPAGLSLDIPHLSSCSGARLLARGPSGCQVQSALGRGRGLVEAHEGTETIAENATLWVFLGPPDNLQPTFEILARGYTPVDEAKVFGGTVVPAGAPYGEELEMSLPAIPTLALEPNASVATLSLTIGMSRHRGARTGNSILVPASCPAGGFPFAAEFTYADGSSGSALATIPCPR